MTFLDVPFVEKDQAKSLGARWDAVSKRWYIPDTFDGDLNAFAKWLPAENMSPNDLFTQHNEATDEQKGMSLSEVMNRVQTVLRQGFPGATWVVAEISNINTRRGHIYLELSETNQQGQMVASCRAMIWQSQAGRLLTRFQTETGSELTVGQKVLFLAEVSFHSQYGFSLAIQDLDPSYTLGELEQNLNQIRKNLIKKGIYQQNKQQYLAEDFFRIAVIAPPEAAGLGDFRADADILQKHQLCEFKYFYSSFQGDAVETEMTAAIEAVLSLHQSNPYDALVIIRGGGAKLDLSMLNIESIAEKLCSIELAIMSGIGHERDNTIIDEIAHSRFDTPSKVIGYIRNQIVQQAKAAQNNWQQIEKTSVVSVQRLHNQINILQHGIIQNSQTITSRWQKALEPVIHEISRLSSRQINQVSQKIELTQQQIESTVVKHVAKTAMELDQLKSAVQERSLRTVETQKQQIIQSIAFILSSGPKAQLNRGFAMVKNQQSKPVTTAIKALNEPEIELQFSDGAIKAQIDPSQTIKTQDIKDHDE